MSDSNFRALKAALTQGLVVSQDYVTNGRALRNVAGWTRYKNTIPASTPEVSPGGTAVVLANPARSTTNPLRLNGATIEFAKASGSALGEGYYTDIEINAIDENRDLQVAVDYYIASGTLAAGSPADLEINVADLDNGVILTTADKRLTGTGSGRYSVVATFTSVIASGGANSRKYRIYLHCATSTASAFTIRFNLACGPGYTATGGGGGGFLTNGAGTRAAPVDVDAATTILTDNKLQSVMYVQGNGGSVTMTASPQLTTAGIDEHNILVLRGRSDSQTVTFVNGNGLSIKGDCTLGSDDSLTLMFDGTNWVEQSRS